MSATATAAVSKAGAVKKDSVPEMFADFGSAVTVLQHSAEFLPREDADIATAIREQLEAQGVKFLFHAETKEIAPASAGGVRLSVAVKGSTKATPEKNASANSTTTPLQETYEADQPTSAAHPSEAQFCLTADAVLVATGRTPNIEGLNLRKHPCRADVSHQSSVGRSCPGHSCTSWRILPNNRRPLDVCCRRKW